MPHITVSLTATTEISTFHQRLFANRRISHHKVLASPNPPQRDEEQLSRLETPHNGCRLSNLQFQTSSWPLRFLTLRFCPYHRALMMRLYISGAHADWRAENIWRRPRCRDHIWRKGWNSECQPNGKGSLNQWRLFATSQSPGLLKYYNNRKLRQQAEQIKY